MVVEEILEKLKLALNNADFNTNEFENILKSMVEQEKVKIKILDFEYYNEERLKHAQKEKIEGVKSQNFEWAASWRDKEKKILKYIELREEFDINLNCNNTGGGGSSDTGGTSTSGGTSTTGSGEGGGGTTYSSNNSNTDPNVLTTPVNPVKNFNQVKTPCDNLKKHLSTITGIKRKLKKQISLKFQLLTPIVVR